MSSRKSRHTIRIHIPSLVFAVMISTVIGVAMGLTGWPALIVGVAVTFGARAAWHQLRREVRKVTRPRRRHLHF